MHTQYPDITTTNCQTSSLNYFTCTLGQAAEYNSGLPRDFHTINDFLDLQARLHPESPAVGFPVLGSENRDWHYELFSYEELRRGSIAVLNELYSTSSFKLDTETQCVALLCPSSVDFLFTWLALTRAGLSVLLIAVSLLFYDHRYAELAITSASETPENLVASELPWQALKEDVISLVRSPKASQKGQHLRLASEYDVAYIHHTSGTSSGLPKPIPQTHHAAVCVLPCLSGCDLATLTTTPLYHGGIADCFRAWTSQSLIWLFPGADLPITTKNIISSLSVSTQAHQDRRGTPIVKYFSSVPYVLQMLADDRTGMDLLLEMELVGVGGAALSQSMGDMLVSKGVNLVSRFGSAECGFLLSSHRPYRFDKAWQYLRVPPNSQFLRFEEQADESGLSELIVLKGWPHMARTNRENGNFATSDLFEPHPTLEAAWRYHSRSDSQITLTTGKKFDPAPLEDAITSSSALIKDVLVFGNGRRVPGALIFTSELGDRMEGATLLEKVWAAVDEVNGKGQDHTGISRDMLVFMGPGSAILEKSSKGSILRGAAEKTFAKEIGNSYVANDSTTKSFNGTLGAEDIKSIVRNIVHDVIGGEHALPDDADFYHSGCDSTKCTRIRNVLQQQAINGNVKLPWNIVYDCGNIDKLSEYLIQIANGFEAEETCEIQQMLDLVDQFSSFGISANGVSLASVHGSTKDHGIHVVLLTGATGALGAHILHLLRCDSSVSRIICLVRAANGTKARERISASLIRRRKPALDGLDDGRIICLTAQPGNLELSLSSGELGYIRENLTLVIHAAWAVNFSLPLRSFVKDHLAGLHNLINLALSCTNVVSFAFCSSTASVLGPSNATLIPETISKSPSDADSLGYSRSKWVAEAICNRACRAGRIRIKIFRIGQLTGDTENGVWNMSEAWPLMLSTVDTLRCLPQLEEMLSWLPLDIAAEAVLEIATSQLSRDSKREDKGEPEDNCPVYHLVNACRSPTWTDLLGWLRHAQGPERAFKIVEPVTWLRRLEALESHPAKNLLGLWRKAYGQVVSSQGDEVKAVTFDVEKAKRASNAMKHMSGVDEILFRKIWAWIGEAMQREK